VSSNPSPSSSESGENQRAGCGRPNRKGKDRLSCVSPLAVQRDIGRDAYIRGADALCNPVVGRVCAM
jgi:hypothetical protein